MDSGILDHCPKYLRKFAGDPLLHSRGGGGEEREGGGGGTPRRKLEITGVLSGFSTTIHKGNCCILRSKDREGISDL